MFRGLYDFSIPVLTAAAGEQVFIAAQWFCIVLRITVCTFNVKICICALDWSSILWKWLPRASCVCCGDAVRGGGWMAGGGLSNGILRNMHETNKSKLNKMAICQCLHVKEWPNRRGRCKHWDRPSTKALLKEPTCPSVLIVVCGIWIRIKVELDLTFWLQCSSFQELQMAVAPQDQG